MKKIMLVLLLILIVGCGTVKNKIVTMETNKGVVKIELFDDRAPITTKNFKDLVSKGFYDGLTFHRYAELAPGSHIIQGGDPNGDGTGGSDKKIPLETRPDLKHERGSIAMARSSDPNSASSQFYFAFSPITHLDGQYAVFGKIVEGLDVAESLREGDKMTKVTVS